MAVRGRPRAFDEEEVLDVAMRLFWEHGFDGTSMSELTEASGPTLTVPATHRRPLIRSTSCHRLTKNQDAPARRLSLGLDDIIIMELKLQSCVIRPIMRADTAAQRSFDTLLAATSADDYDQDTDELDAATGTRR